MDKPSLTSLLVYYFPCGSDMPINSSNSDAKCHRKLTAWAKRLVKKNIKICDNCIYIKQNGI